MRAVCVGLLVALTVLDGAATAWAQPTAHPGELPWRPVPVAPLPDSVPPPPPPPPPGPFGGPLDYVPTPPRGRRAPVDPYCPVDDGDTLFFGLEFALISPHIRSPFGRNDPFGAGSGSVSHASLDWTVSPTFEIGYRLPNQLGAFTFDYRFLVSEGDGRQVYPSGTYDVRTRLAVNVLDFDYNSRPIDFARRWQLQYRLGARLLDVFYDSRMTAPGFIRAASNDFVGGGPHARLDLYRRFDFLPELSLFGRIDGSVVLGEVDQRFRERFRDPIEGLTLAQDVSRRRNSTVPTLGVQAGLNYAPEGFRNFRLTTGYGFEEIFEVGSLGLGDDGLPSRSRGDIWSHGWFLRGQIDF